MTRMLVGEPCTATLLHDGSAVQLLVGDWIKPIPHTPEGTFAALLGGYWQPVKIQKDQLHKIDAPSTQET